MNEPDKNASASDLATVSSSTENNANVAEPQADQAQADQAQAGPMQTDQAQPDQTDQASESTPSEMPGDSIAPPAAAKPVTSGPLAGRVGNGPLAARRAASGAPAPPPASKPPTSKPHAGQSSGKPAPPAASASAQQQPVEQTSSPLDQLTTQQRIEADRAQGAAASEADAQQRESKRAKKRGGKGEKGSSSQDAQITPPPRKRIAVPNVRAPLPDDLEALLNQELADSDVESMLGGNAGMPMRDALSEGQRVHATVIKKSPDFVFVSLGGPDEGTVPFEQFEHEPEVGARLEVLVRSFNNEDGLYVCVLPGQAIDASGWEELEEGTVVEAYISGLCNGGVEAKVGSMRGFIPISQLSEFRIESAEEYVDKKLMCVVTEANERRKNLVLSHRAVLERERAERRAAQMEKIAVGDSLEGTVRSVKDFGAFVDMGGVEGLIHISKLSWDHIKHPSEVLQEGQKVRVKIDKIDQDTGKIGLSYRDLLEHPWDNIDAKFPIGSTARGTVSRVANFGAFVRLSTGIEGLIHISELAHHRVFKVDNIVKEGEEVEVKILTVDREAQRIGLSLKALHAQPEPEVKKDGNEEQEDDTPPPEPVIKKQFDGPLRGGKDGDAGGAKFGLKW